MKYKIEGQITLNFSCTVIADNPDEAERIAKDKAADSCVDFGDPVDEAEIDSMTDENGKKV